MTDPTGSPFDDQLGITIESATIDLVTATLDVDPQRHTQPMGMVHGGVYCAMVETTASVGAALTAAAGGLVPVGMENHTSFLRPVRGGRLLAVATPVARGRTTHLWEVLISDDQGRAVAKGSVRLALIAPRS